ncbi:SGNH/GDSL hydrolase family protein [Actinoplanes sp. NPDC051494]|uniref:SGNH/GDSL hydrolase family protein n=1 Tax=Actinoplanes sp. NPDC051494 TaxID=3363907 RepID=UPI0037BBD6A0
MSYRRILGAVIAAVTTAVLVPTAADASASTTRYVALGDSYASGVGAPPYLDAECLRSDNAYPSLLAAGKPFTFAACSGATTADLLANQLGGLNRRTKLVTVTIGGNDLGFGNGVRTCLLGTDADCLAVVAAAKQFSAEVLPGRLDSVYRTVKHRAPHATLVVTGYARFFEPTEVCATVPMSLTKRVALNEAVDTLDATIARRARRAGARFADVRPAFAGHGLCGADPWITGPADPAAFHPTAAGHRDGYLPSVRKALTGRH